MREDKVFLDTNIFIYAYSSSEPDKRHLAVQIFDVYCCVASMQILNEISNVLFQKNKYSAEKIYEYLNDIENNCSEILLITRATINSALSLKQVYGYSFYDCLVLASALEAGCDTLFTEDMQHGRLIQGRLTIKNPFI